MLRSLNASDTALLVIDKQFSYMANNQPIGGVVDSRMDKIESLVPKIDDYINVCRNNGVLVIWTQMIEDPDLSPLVISSKMKEDGTPAISTPDTEGFGFAGIGPNSGEKVITKKYYSAFDQTDLDTHLKSKGIVNLIIVGGYASRCVLSTAFGANGHDYSVVVLEDLVGNPDRLSEELSASLSIVNAVIGYAIPKDSLVIHRF